MSRFKKSSMTPKPIEDLCKQHNNNLNSHPKRGVLLQLLRDNGADADDAEVMADAIIDHFDQKEAMNKG